MTPEEFLVACGWKQNEDGYWWMDGFYADHTLGMALKETADLWRAFMQKRRNAA